MEDVINSQGSTKAHSLQALANLKFVAVGGGPLHPSVADALDEASITLLNHYGVTEIGAIAPIFVPSSGYDRRYLRLRRDINLQLRLVDRSSLKDGAARYKLIGFPFGWNAPCEIQDEIVIRPIQDGDHLDIQILGRRDDLIVLKTGEKVSLRQIEGPLMRDRNIKTAACVGTGFFELVVIIEPSERTRMNKKALKDHVWGLLIALNPELDGHARISSKEAIIVKSDEKIIPRSDKDSVMRKELREIFKSEITAAQEGLETTSFSKNLRIDPTDIETSISRAIDLVTDGKFIARGLSSGQDLFEIGMDSLKLRGWLGHLRTLCRV